MIEEMVAKESENMETKKELAEAKAESKALKRENESLKMRHQGLTEELRNIKARYGLEQ